jgi:predicted nucleotidyltransferase component of viral defense system
VVPIAFVRQFAAGQRVGVDVADLEIVLVYALAILNEEGLTGQLKDGALGPLLFKGGTALRKCVFGSTGRFSRDLDFDAANRNGFEAQLEHALQSRQPFFGIRFSIADFRYSSDDNFSATIAYAHDQGGDRFELQISYRAVGILPSRDLALIPQSYFRRLEVAVPGLYGLDPYEMIGEKIMACNRRVGGSGKDPYDLFLWAGRPFSDDLVRRLAVLKCWTDRATRFDPDAFLARVVPENYLWDDLLPLVPGGRESDPRVICQVVQERFGFLRNCSAEESRLLQDFQAHREQALFEQLSAEARDWALAAAR